MRLLPQKTTMKTRLIQDGVPLHVYNKGYDGNLLFYTIFDYLSFFTALSCLSAKYGVELIALTLMPNHYHCLQLGERKAIIKFNQDLASWYAKEFNSVYNIDGQLFSTPYGRAPKSIGKQIRATIAYILNNPASAAFPTASSNTAGISFLIMAIPILFRKPMLLRKLR